MPKITDPVETPQLKETRQLKIVAHAERARKPQRRPRTLPGLTTRTHYFSSELPAPDRFKMILLRVNVQPDGSVDVEAFYQ